MDHRLHDLTRRRGEQETTVRGESHTRTAYLAPNANVPTGDILIDNGTEITVTRVTPTPGCATVDHLEPAVRKTPLRRPRAA
jgi:hypothetical protein